MVDDYAHHPTEIAAVIGGARQRFPAAAFGCRLPAAYLHTHQSLCASLPGLWLWPMKCW